MNPLDALRDELRKPVGGSGSASEVWMRARLDSLLDDDQRARRVRRVLSFVQLIAADGAAAALVWPIAQGNLGLVLLAMMAAHAIGTMWVVSEVR